TFEMLPRQCEIAGLGYDPYAGGPVEHPPEAVAHLGVVVGDHRGDRAARPLGLVVIHGLTVGERATGAIGTPPLVAVENYRRRGPLARRRPGPGAATTRSLTSRAVSGPQQPAGEPNSIRIVLADDHLVVRSGLRLVLDAEEEFSVVAEASDVESARRYVRGHHPAVLVLDLNMP